jgi:TPR repeat protein
MSQNEGLIAYRQKDFEKAKSIWEEEIKTNNDQAMTNLGLLYLKGEGVEKDFEKAKEYFQMGAKLDNDSAHYNLALMYQSAIGIPEDMPKAIEHFRQAVKSNHQGASFRLGLLLLKDRTDKILVKEGFECMLNAAKSGHPMATVQMGGIDNVPNIKAKPNEEFRNKTKENQIEVLEDAINRYIRPILVRDNGDIMLLDYINEPDIEIRLAYQGACAGCSLGATSTYALIKDTISKVIDENIRIYII